MTFRQVPAAVFSAVLLIPLVGCEAQKSDNPLSPSVAGPIAGVAITAPRPLQPAQGTKLKESQQPIALVVENSSTNGVRPIAYTFEVSSDSAFEIKMYARSGVVAGADGRTSVIVDRLDSGRGYYWRVRAEDGANSSPFSTSDFTVLPKPQLDPPAQHAPVNNELTTSRRPELVVGMSGRNAAIGNVVYEFAVASDVAFSGIVAAGDRPEAGPTTGFAPDRDLAASTTYYWRVRATDGAYTGNWSAAQSFRTPAAPAPGPGPGPGPGPTTPGAPCNSGSPTAILDCERSKFGFMGEAEIMAFLRNVSDSLNRNSIPGGRFGLLLKPTGHNCSGYSCDIICSGNGGSQRQWDVLVDAGGATIPIWSEVSNITLRVCEIR